MKWIQKLGLKTADYCYIDFEFNRVNDELVNLVSACVLHNGVSHDFWLHSDKDEQKKLAEFLKDIPIIISYAAVAEGRSLLSLGMNPLDKKWIDLFIEYRCISNHNDRLNWGKQLVDGKVKMTVKPKPKWERTEEDESTGFKPTHSLAEATYKLTGEIRDTDEKDRIRNIIISDPEEFGLVTKSAILSYGEDDVKFLPTIFEKILEEFSFQGIEIDSVLLEEMLLRGRYSAHTSIMESKGYPIDLEKTRNFSNSVSMIMFDCQREINSLFPNIQPFEWSKKENRFNWRQKITREWISSNCDVEKWKKTDKGDLSLSLDAFEKVFDYSHDYPKDNFGAQMVRFLKLKQNLYGFVPSPDKKKKTFWDFVGKDGRVRPYTNPFGAQSSRSQPSSTGFMFLKPAWMRALVIPESGYAMGGIDYGSEEFLIQALESEDYAMIEAYLSGDVYLAFAKDAGMAPPDATKESHKSARNICKSTVLGLSYLMSKYGLANKLTQDTKEIWSEDDAEEMIKKFQEAYPELKSYQDNVPDEYRNTGNVKLPCGWYMFGDNDNFRSVTNVKIQGMGASIMRKAVDLAVSRGLYVCITLHDALYIEYKVGEEYKMAILRDCMREAFVHYFPEHLKSYANKIKLDPFIWSRDYEPDSMYDIGGWLVPASNLYIDERAVEDYNAFSKYFEKREEDLL